MTWIAMAGLPGTGKSTIARRLSELLQAPVLDKDRIRAALFEPGHLAYTREQDDVCMRAAYDAAAFLARASGGHVILDGRTFVRTDQVADLARRAEEVPVPWIVVECVCSAAVAEARIERQESEGLHPAKNRDVALYRRLRAEAEEIRAPKIVLDTSEAIVEDNASRVIEFLRARGLAR